MAPVSVSSVRSAKIFVDTWSAGYGSPNSIDDAVDEATGELVPEEGFEFIRPPLSEDTRPTAFVDGIRRQEAALSLWPNDTVVPGIAGAYAVGAVLVDPDMPPCFGPVITKRLVIWSAGQTATLPPTGASWSWETASTPETGPKAALRTLQDRMQDAEANLARTLAANGYDVLTDGTLWATAGAGQSTITGYVKTHHRRLLPSEYAQRLPGLPAGMRTTLFSTDRRYTCYLRLMEMTPYLAPLAGVVRLEFSGSLAEARASADRYAAMLPRYAGVLHVDPRAPQNLQPIGALETHLRHLLGDSALAERAVRDAVANQADREGKNGH